MEAKKENCAEASEFHGVFDSLLKDLLAIPQLNALPGTNDWVEQALRYNVVNSKLNCYFIITSVYRLLVKHDRPKEDAGLVEALACIYEIVSHKFARKNMEAAFLVVDDIMDDSVARRGQPCWYITVDSIGELAFNDALSMLQLVFKAIKLKFKAKPYYGELIKVLHKLNLLICLGQSIDMREGTGKDVESYTSPLYSTITRYKGAYPFAYGPLALALAMAGMDHSRLQAETMLVIRDVGELLVVSNDYCDVFGDIKHDGKIGNDIVQGKCTWLVVKALEKAANSAEKQIIKDNYGKTGPKNAEVCKDTFVKLGIQELYHSHVQILKDSIESRTDRMSPVFKAIFLHVLKFCKGGGKDFAVV